MQNEDSQLDVAVCPSQGTARLLAAAPGEPREYAFAAPHELLVDGLKINHEAVVDPAEQYHDQG